MPRPSAVPTITATRHARAMFADFLCGCWPALASAAGGRAEAGAGSLFSGIWMPVPQRAHLPRFPAKAAGARSWAPQFLQNVTIVVGTDSVAIAPSPQV
jgi:hypothetical protein